MQYKNPRNKTLVLEALRLSNRTDLIGSGPKCLIDDGLSKDFRRSNFRKTSNKRK